MSLLSKSQATNLLVCGSTPLKRTSNSEKHSRRKHLMIYHESGPAIFPEDSIFLVTIESLLLYGCDGWTLTKAVMTKMPKRQHTCRTGKAKFPALERTLKEWVISQREKSRAFTTIMICFKAKELAKQMNVAEFVGGLSWCGRFMHLSVRARTTVGQKLPNDWEPSFLNTLMRDTGC